MTIIQGSLPEPGTPEYYALTDPQLLEYGDLSKLSINFWQAIDPYRDKGRPFTDRDIAKLVVHFSHGRLFCDLVREKWAAIGENGLVTSDNAYDIGFRQVAKWFNTYINKRPDSPQKDRDVGFYRAAAMALDNATKMENVKKLLKIEMELRVKNPLEAWELPVTVKDALSGGYFIGVLSLLTGVVRLAREFDDIFPLTPLEIPLTGLPSPEKPFSATRFNRILENFFGHHPDKAQKKTFFGRWMVYQMLRGNPEEKITYWEGVSGTGKNVTFDLIRAMIGRDRVVKLKKELFKLNHTGQEYAFSKLDGATSSYTDEIDADFKMDLNKLKEATNDDQSGRQIYRGDRWFDLTNSHNLISNYPMPWNDDTLKRRWIKLKTGGVQLAEAEDVEGREIPTKERHYYKRIWEEEKWAIIHWLIERCKEYNPLKRGYNLRIPHDFSGFTESYSLAGTAEWFQYFYPYLMGRGLATLAPDVEADGDIVKGIFFEWCDENRRKGLTVQSLGREMKKIGHQGRQSNGKTFYKGLKVVREDFNMENCGEIFVKEKI